MSNCMSIPIGAGGGVPAPGAGGGARSRIACRASSPDRSSAPAAVIRGSCQVTVRDRGSPQASGAAGSAGASAVIVVLVDRQAGGGPAGGGEHPIDAGVVDRLAAGAADPRGVDDVVGVRAGGVVQFDR